jgi:uncharacterized protein (TIGR02118 family)
MVKVTVLYGKPDDAAAFEDYYANKHMPLANEIPNVLRFESGVVSTTDGSEPPYQRIAELWFESAEMMEQSLGSEEGQAATGDLPNFATGGATILVSEVE